VLEKFLHFVTAYDQMLIAVSASGVVVLVAVWIFLDVFVHKSSTSAEADFAKIEASIEKFIQKADAVRATVVAPGAPSGSGADPAELVKLKQELDAKKAEVETLKSKAAKPHEDNTPELLTKIRDLESRLAEYEIIEDDIADLSHYKEENEKLKKQLADIGGAPADAASAAETSAPAPAPEVEPPVGPPMPTSEAVAAEPVANPLVEDFSKAVDNLQAEVVAPAAPTAPTLGQEEAAPGVAPDAAGDVFSEFEEKTGDVDPLAELGEIDTNRMLEELQGLEIDTAAASADVLTETPDIDKMAQEAEGLKGGKR
jgi:hypothetical protein